MEVQPRNLETYVTDDGRRPFTVWLDSLRDQKAVSKIDARLERVKQGNLGDVNPLVMVYLN
jgi:putative component of toxin-antitoxin plasmid stabilization module